MPNSAIWLLVADEHAARIYESREGSSRLIRSLTNTAMPAASLWTDAGEAAANVVPLQGHDAVPKNERDRNRKFAFQLIGALLDAAESGACDGIIVVATCEMLEALRRVRPAVVTRLLIAEIVECAPDLEAGIALPALAADLPGDSTSVVKFPLAGSGDFVAAPTAKRSQPALNTATFAEVRRLKEAAIVRSKARHMARARSHASEH